jgi:hypothetical protein
MPLAGLDMTDAGLDMNVDDSAVDGLIRRRTAQQIGADVVV